MQRSLQNRLFELFPSRLIPQPSAWLEMARERRELERTRLTHEDKWLATAKDLHKGKRCFIIATGPSLNDLDLTRLKGEITFGVNGTYLLDQVDLTYYAYVSNWWHKDHIEGIRNVRCERRFIPNDYHEELASDTPTSWYRRIMSKTKSKYELPLPVPRDFSHCPQNYIHAGGTVVFVCLQIAFHMGFDEVIIIGLDHNYTQSDGKKLQNDSKFLKVEGEDKSHFFKDYFKKGVRAHVDLDAMERGYAIAHKTYQRAGRRILNASSRSELITFPKVRYDDLW